MKKKILAFLLAVSMCWSVFAPASQAAAISNYGYGYYTYYYYAQMGTDKATYKTGETANIVLTMYDSYGYVIGGAPIHFEMHAPNGKVYVADRTTDYYGRASFQALIDQTQSGNCTVYAYYQGQHMATTSFTIASEKPVEKVLNAQISFSQTSVDLGTPVSFNVKVTDAEGRAVQYARVDAKVTSPSGKIFTKNGSSNSAGTASFTYSENTLNESGQYTVEVTASGSGYTEGTARAQFTVNAPTPKPEPGFFKLIETDEAQKIIEKERKNPQFVLLDVRTKAEFMESHIEGAIQHDLYASDFKSFIASLDPNKIYLVYCRTQVRSGETVELMKELGFKSVYWMNGGMTKWLREGRPSVFPTYDKSLDVELRSGKTSVKPGSTLEMFIRVKDLQQNPIRKANVHLQVVNADGKVLDQADITMGNTGDAQWTWSVPKDAQHGSYKIVANASYNDFKPGQGIYMFTVGESEDDGFLTFEQRESRGDFSHLDKTEYEYASLKKFYGQNILKYRVKDNQKNIRTLADLVEPGKKTLLVFGYPGCGPCVDMWRAMGKLAHKEYNFIEVVTSVEDDVQSTIDFADRVLKENNLWHMRDHIFYDAVDLIWGSRLELLTTPNSLLLDEQGRLVNIAGPLDAPKLKAMMEKTFGLSIDITEVDHGDDIKPPAPANAMLQLEKDRENITTDEIVWFTMRAYDENGEIMSDVPFTLKASNNHGWSKEYARTSPKNGILKFGLRANENAVAANYTFTASCTTKSGKKLSQSTSFTITLGGTPATDGLRVELTPSKSNYTSSEEATITVTVTDAQNRPVASANLSGALTLPSGQARAINGTTNQSGQQTISIPASTKSASGEYSVSITASKNGYSSGSGRTQFTVSGNEPAPSGKQLTYEQRSRNGEFNHLKDSDLASKIRSVYGKDIKNYTLYKLDGTKVTVGDLIDGRRPTVIGLGYPGCSACQNSWKNLNRIDSSSFTLLEALTSGSAAEVKNTLSRLGIAEFSSHFHTNGNPIFNLVGASYVPLIVYLDKDGHITNIGYFNSNDEVLRIIKTIEGTTSVQ